MASLSTSATEEPSHAPDAPLSFNAAWQSAQNVVTSFPCPLHMEVPTLIFTGNTLEDLSDKRRKQCTLTFSCSIFLSELLFELAILVTCG